MLGIRSEVLSWSQLCLGMKLMLFIEMSVQTDNSK